MTGNSGDAGTKKEPHPMLRLVDRQRTPEHVGIIMDGNGRWAKARGLVRIEGHKAGIDGVKAAVEAAQDLKLKYLTLYAFSVENWKRPASEVRALFQLLSRYIDQEHKRILDTGIRFRVIGRIADLPKGPRAKLEKLIEETRDAEGMTLTLALSYGGRTEIADACDTIVRRTLAGEREGPVTEAEFARHLYAPDLPDPDLLIRTSGEYRVSNFLLWQIAYSELVILDILWPDFREEHFIEAVLDFQRRERRYGGVSGAAKRKATPGAAR